MKLECFCGISFTTVNQLYQHATSQGHRIRCSCGKLIGSDTQLKIHQRTAQHGWKYEKLKPLHGLPGIDLGSQGHHNQSYTPSPGRPPAFTYACNLCNRTAFKDTEALDQHKAAKHPSCPTCHKVFHDKFGKNGRSAQDQLLCHQQGTGHCHCAEHGVPFSSVDQFQAHKLTYHSGVYREPSSNLEYEASDVLGPHFGSAPDAPDEDEITQHKIAASFESGQHSTAISICRPLQARSWLDDDLDFGSDTSDSGGVALY